ncbi:cytochrome b/b6 [Sphingomonas sp. T9W2]|uniref:cytochrome b n=1 Tax=Sphingomonas sp. T9W2 TaxID=3143183 RepID=UPI0031F4C4A8
MSFPWAKHYEPKQPLMRWLDEKLPLPRLVYNAVGAGYPVPRNLNYFWNFGVLAGAALAVQIITGIVLAMHYAANGAVAFDSVERIMRDVPSGWFLRYAHANGASMFFIVVYTHIARGIYYGSYKAPREMVWLLGVVIFLLMMATAFMGYVLPWGQMSFWGAQVITGFFSAIPGVGETIRVWLLGGYAPDNAALNRFFSLHYLLPFVIAGVIVLHIWALHIPGSNNPTGVEVKGPQDTVPFHPYYTAKDGFGLGVFLIVFASLIFFAPNLLGHPDNYIPANPLSTPAHIVPEWYFLPFYAILKAFTVDFILPAKLWGVLAMFGSILLLFFLPWLDKSPVKSANFRPTYRLFLIVLLVDVLVLGYLGGAEATPITVLLSQIAAGYYFAHFLVVLPIVSAMERPRPLPNSITEAVLKGEGGTSPAQTAAHGSVLPGHNSPAAAE